VAERIIEVNDLWVRFGSKDVVRGVSFHIERGETLALVGESGSGKSVTALSILQLLPYPLAAHPKGSIKVLGTEMIAADKKTLLSIRGGKISMVFQEPMTSLNPLHTIAKQVGEVLVVHRGMKPEETRDRTLELLRLVGLQNAEERLDALPHELSGGQRQRVMIAMALANEPELLIADEPTTALDVTIQAQILDLLKELQAKLGMALLLITHNLGIVRTMAERVIVMNQGEIVEHGPMQRVFKDPQHSYTRHLLESEPKGQPAEAPADAPEVVRAENLTVRYPVSKGWFGRKRYLTAVNNVSISVRQGYTVGVVGESGSGKTTLGLALLRLIRSEGRIVFCGTELHNKRARELKPLRADMQIVFQDPYGSLSPRLSIGQIIEEGLLVHFSKLSFDERRERVFTALDEVGLDPDMIDRYPHEFSGGQRQRISIARAMVLKPKLVVLDEPTSALDMSVQAQIVDLLRDLQRRHKLAYLFVSHDLKVVRALADEVIVMRNGIIVEQGMGRQIFANPQAEYTKTLFEAAFT
jgi:microcin C transport system ATP-binding protein